MKKLFLYDQLQSQQQPASRESGFVLICLLKSL
jgi:hypothetical protein